MHALYIGTLNLICHLLWQNFHSLQTVLSSAKLCNILECGETEVSLCIIGEVTE